MSRDIGAANITHVDGSHVHEVILVNFQFDTPLYVHSGIGSIVYNANTYLGVGDFGSIGTASESESVTPSPVQLTLSGIPASTITEALDAGNFGDVVTIYAGYRNDDGTLVGDPWVVTGGTYDNADIKLGAENSISITIQHDLAKLTDSFGRKYTDEDQQGEFAGDIGFSFVADSIDKKLSWGGKTAWNGSRHGNDGGTTGDQRTN